METKQSKCQKISHEILSLLSPLSCYLHGFTYSLSLSPLFPLSLNGPNLSIISIKTKGTKEFIKKKKKGTKDVSSMQPKGKKKKKKKATKQIQFFIR